MKNKSSFLLVLCLGFVIIGCKKQADNTFDTKYQNMAKENALIQGAFDDILKISENILMNNGNAKIETAAAPLGCLSNIDTVVTGTNQKTYTVVFDPSCTSYDGKPRRGILTIQLNGTSYNASGSTVTITLNDYHVSGYHVQGKVVVVNEGNDVFKVNVTNLTGDGFASLYVAELSKQTQWKSSHKRTLYEGGSDMIIINNKYKIDVYAGDSIPFEGITTDNNHYFGKIPSSLTLDYTCTATGKIRYPTTGWIAYDLEGLRRNVSYGSGECDLLCTMSWGGASTVISLY